MKKHTLVAVAMATVATIALAQNVLKEQLADNQTTLYIDGGTLGGAGAQNNARVVRVQKWNCPAGTIRPANGAVVFIGPPQWMPQNIALPTRKCLLRTFDPDSGAETDQIVDMLQTGDDGSYYVTTGNQGDRTNGESDSSGSATAALAAAAAGAGYFNPCTANPFAFCSGPPPNCYTDPYGCYCYYSTCPHGYAGRAEKK